MLLLSSQNEVGINSFFPLIVSKKYRKISAIEWSHYRRFLPLYVIANSIISTILLFLIQNSANSNFDSIYTVISALELIYVFCRLNFGRKMIELDSRTNLTVCVAPYIVWLDYISTGAMFILTAKIGLLSTESDIMAAIFHVMKIFFLAYSFLPLLNYLKYRQSN
ncbi:hypothetical protein [Undibacterium sp. Xuan67W]|uniref:hypothetical protein n=1 Tax=Undibacterium sp. Xuan67W TaxID=3413057 RepID=UPI003BF179FD